MPLAKYMRVNLKRINLEMNKGRKPLLNDKPVDLFDIQKDLLTDVLSYGSLKITEDGEFVWEMDRPVCCEILSAYTTTKPKPIGLGEKALKEYAKSFLNPDKGGFVYTYGERLVPQLDVVMKMLRQHRTTRRAIINIGKDTDKFLPSMPCMQQMQFTIDLNGYLQMDVVFRSHDMLSAWYNNVFGLMYLQNYLCNKYYYSPGIIRITSFRPHVYVKRDAAELIVLGMNPDDYK